MIRASDVAVILLAAGLSHRFGPSKLSVPFRGKPLALHAAEMLDEIAFARRICVWSRNTGSVADAISALGYQMVEQNAPELGLGASIALGMGSVISPEPQAIMVVLADMPMVSRNHIATMLNALRDRDDLVASSDGRTVMPPALFGRRFFEMLASLTGDRGPRHLLINARRIEAAPGELIDIDVREDIANVRASRRTPRRGAYRRAPSPSSH